VTDSVEVRDSVEVANLVDVAVDNWVEVSRTVFVAGPPIT
jgi:hypothetical protein